MDDCNFLDKWTVSLDNCSFGGLLYSIMDDFTMWMTV